MSLSSDKELGELSSSDSDVDDLFSCYNKYYQDSLCFPQSSPISFKYTGVPSASKFTDLARRSTESQLNELQVSEVLNGIFSETDWLNEPFLQGFGEQEYPLASNLNIFSKQQVREKWIQLWTKLLQTDKVVLQSLKRQRWNGIANTFTDWKAIKMANLAFLTGKEVDVISPLQPRNFLENKFTFLAFVNAPGYAEFILDNCSKHYPSFKVKGFILPQNKFLSRLHNSQLQINWQPQIEVLNKLPNDQFTQSYLKEIVETVKSQNQYVDLIIGIKSVSQLGLQLFDKIESPLIPFLFGYLVLATQLFTSPDSVLITKFYTSFIPKTCEYLFLLYVLFDQIVVFRPITTFVLSNEKFLICQNFHFKIAEQLKDTLINNFDKYLASSESPCLLNIETITSDNCFLNIMQAINQNILGKFLVKLQEIITKGDFSNSQNEIINSQLYKWKLSFASPPPPEEIEQEKFQQRQKHYQYQSYQTQNVPRLQIYENQHKNLVLERSKNLYAQKDLLDFLGPNKSQQNRHSKNQNSHNQRHQQTHQEKAMDELTGIFEGRKHSHRRPPKK